MLLNTFGLNQTLIAINQPGTDLLLLSYSITAVVEQHQLQLVAARALQDAKNFSAIFLGTIKTFAPRERFSRIELNQTLMVFPFFQCQLTNHDGEVLNLFSAVFFRRRTNFVSVFLMI